MPPDSGTGSTLPQAISCLYQNLKTPDTSTTGSPLHRQFFPNQRPDVYSQHHSRIAEGDPVERVNLKETMMTTAKSSVLWIAVLSLSATLAYAQPAEPQSRQPDVHFVPTPDSVVEAMLKLANVQKTDVVYDLGCGDGRTVIRAADQFGARAVGIDIDPERIEESKENARKAGVEDRVAFRNEDLFEADISEATVVTLYLLNKLNLKLRPKLWKELKPGTRIVSHAFSMGDWEPEKKIQADGRTIYLWIIRDEGVALQAGAGSQ
jgi:protein-L-isoaspartate O-methyltransferase